MNLSRVRLAVLAAGLVACGVSSTSNGNTAANKTFVTTLDNGGTLTLAFGAASLQAAPRSELASTVAVTGSYAPPGATAIPLGGTYDPSTNAFTMSGGGYGVAGTYAPVTGTVSGTLTPPAGAALSFTAAATGGGSFTPGTGSCNVTVSGAIAACEEYPPGFTTQLQQDCEPAKCNATVNGVTATCAFSTGQCSPTNRLGRCVYASAALTYQVAYYNVSGITQPAAQQACQQANGVGGVATSWTNG